MYSRIRSAVCFGMEGREVFVETDISRGLPSIGVVGLASTMVMESRERIRKAIENSGYEYPKGRITVNLTPASLRKNSSCLDLPIAIGILASEGNIRVRVAEDWAVIGELALDGRVLGVEGALPMMLHMKDIGVKGIIVPEANRMEAVLAGGNIFTVRSLRECSILMCMDPVKAAADPEVAMLKACKGNDLAEMFNEDSSQNMKTESDQEFGDIVGQENAKRAVVIAAAGRHGLLMVGSPGCGKTMIAGRMAGVMPAMTEREMLETAIVRSISGYGMDSFRMWNRRPFRAPHHTIGRAGLIGGGLYPVPGEITLAHNGVLFLDEICEFNKETIESLRIPIEEKKITHFRKGEAYTFPCNCQVVMAANPCPCGYLGDRDRECTCTQADLEKYRRKLSGPIIDRIDMYINMEKVEYKDLSEKRNGMTTADMRSQVIKAIDFARRQGRKGFNSDLSTREFDIYCRLGDAERKFMNRAYDAFAMSPRAYSRTLKVARTIADIDESDEIKTSHLAEALNYRMKE